MGQIGRPGNTTGSGILVAREYYHPQRSLHPHMQHNMKYNCSLHNLQKDNLRLLQSANLVESAASEKSPTLQFQMYNVLTSCNVSTVHDIQPATCSLLLWYGMVHMIWYGLVCYGMAMFRTLL